MKKIYHNIPQVGNYFYDHEKDAVLSIKACLKYVFDFDCDSVPAFAVLANNDNRVYWITACDFYEGDKETHHGCQWEANP